MAPLQAFRLLIAALHIAGLSSAQKYNYTAEQIYNANRHLSVGYVRVPHQRRTTLGLT